MTGRLAIVGLGPGADDLRSPRAAAALEAATDLVGYGPYLDRVSLAPHQRRHASDNREELARADLALDLAQQGRQVAMVSSGDPGVFAMAAAVFEALERGDAARRSTDIEVVPGVSAVLAAAARIGAPCGNDFCVISLSDNLKPWETVLDRVGMAARAGLAMALYNPVSKARPWQFGRGAGSLAATSCPDMCRWFSPAPSAEADERVDRTTLAEASKRSGRHANAGHRRHRTEPDHRAAGRIRLDLCAAVGREIGPMSRVQPRQARPLRRGPRRWPAAGRGARP